MTKILCATDGAPHSDLPVARAAELATKLGAQLSIIAVSPIASDPRGFRYSLWTEEQQKVAVERAVAVAKNAGVSVSETVSAKGRDAAAVIVNYAASKGFDHIVVGGPRKGIARLIMGSVAASVATKARCAVTVVH